MEFLLEHWTQKRSFDSIKGITLQRHKVYLIEKNQQGGEVYQSQISQKKCMTAISLIDVTFCFNLALYRKYSRFLKSQGFFIYWQTQ